MLRREEGVSWAEYSILSFLIISLGLCGFMIWRANRQADLQSTQLQLSTGKVAKQVAKLQDRYRIQRSLPVETSGNGG